jgi:hypothetical protein
MVDRRTLWKTRPGGLCKSREISTEGGTGALWNRNGRELFYRNGDQLMVVDITTQLDLRASRGLCLQPSRKISSTAVKAI